MAAMAPSNVVALAVFVANILQVFSTGDVICPARGCVDEFDEETALIQLHRTNPKESDVGISGTYTIEITKVQAMRSNGGPLPGTNAQPCIDQYPFFVGSWVWYWVDFNQGVGNATAIVLGQRVPLYPTGLAHTYDFISDILPEYLRNTLQIHQVYLHLKPKGKLLEHQIIINAPAPSNMADPARQCSFKNRVVMHPVAQTA